MNYLIREMHPKEYPLLEDFLYQAIYQPDKTNLAPRSIIKKPELQVYIKDFGTKKDDYCFCAEVDGKIVGAVWVRNINGYGSVDNNTVEFAISVFDEKLNYLRQPLKIQFLFLNIILNSKSEKTYRNITFYIIINIVFT